MPNTNRRSPEEIAAYWHDMAEIYGTNEDRALPDYPVNAGANSDADTLRAARTLTRKAG